MTTKIIKSTDKHLHELVECLSSAQLKEIELIYKCSGAEVISGIEICIGWGPSSGDTHISVLNGIAWHQLDSTPKTHEEKKELYKKLISVFGTNIEHCRYIKATAEPKELLKFSFECLAPTSSQS